jgi:hypothetical protein
MISNKQDDELIAMKEELKKEIREEMKAEKPVLSNWWYALPILLGLLGGILGFIFTITRDKNKALKLLAVGLLVSFTIILIGNFINTEGYDTTYTSAPVFISSPEKTINSYVSYFNNGNGNDIYYNLMSSEFQSQTTGDSIHNLLYGYTLSGIQINDYRVIDTNTDESTATMTIDFIWYIQGIQKTERKEVELILENGEWKLIKMIKLN